MRIEFVAFEKGFKLQINEYDIDMDSIVVFMCILFWGRMIKVLKVQHERDSGRCSFFTFKEGKKSGWEFQAPIRRIG